MRRRSAHFCEGCLLRPPDWIQTSSMLCVCLLIVNVIILVVFDVFVLWLGSGGDQPWLSRNKLKLAVLLGLCRPKGIDHVVADGGADGLLDRRPGTLHRLDHRWRRRRGRRRREPLPRRRCRCRFCGCCSWGECSGCGGYSGC